MEGTKNATRLLDASNRFYTLIPHDFGMQKPPLLDNEDLIKSKCVMLDSLLEIEVAYSLLKQGSGSGAGEDPIDTNYRKLKTEMEVCSFVRMCVGVCFCRLNISCWHLVQSIEGAFEKLPKLLAVSFLYRLLLVLATMISSLLHGTCKTCVWLEDVCHLLCSGVRDLSQVEWPDTSGHGAVCIESENSGKKTEAQLDLAKEEWHSIEQITQISSQYLHPHSKRKESTLCLLRMRLLMATFVLFVSIGFAHVSGKL